jgi:flagellar motor switch/type III secretory pathway protein FliN
VRAIDDESAKRAGEAVGGGSVANGTRSAVDASPHSLALEEALGGISLRVWAELGRTHMPLGAALGLPVGAVVDLDRAADAPVDLYVNGMRFARGQLTVTEDGEWAVSIDGLESEGLRVLDLAQAARTEARQDVEPSAESLATQSDNSTEDRDPTSTPDPEAPEVTQSEVEGAVT